MNTILMSGAESGSAAEMDPSWEVSTSPRRTGAYSYRLYYGKSYLKTLPSAHSELVIGFALYFSAMPNKDPFFSFIHGDSGNPVVSLNVNGTGYLEVRAAWNGALYFTSNRSLNATTWYYIELYFKMDDSGGAIELRIDGISQGTYSGDTKPGAETYFNRLGFYGRSVSYIYIDDIMINTISPDLAGSWPNGAKIVLLKPNGDGSTTQWTPIPSGTHYTTVDEVPPSGADYLQSTSAGEIEELDVENLPSEAFTIAAVRFDMWGLKGSALSPTQVKLGARIGNTNYMSSAKDLGLTLELVSHILNTNPATDTPFTPTDVNSLQIVLESA